MYLNQYWKDERLSFNTYALEEENLDESDYPNTNEEDEDVKDMKDVITLSGDFADVWQWVHSLTYFID